MRLSLYVLAAASMLFTAAVSTGIAQGGAKTYAYESVPGDPLQARIYTLPNGLKVYMSVNKDEPRIQTAIAVKAGSKNDPSDCTGLAHYLEHMLFKGSSQIATTNWAEEKIVLDEISKLFEMHKNTPDTNEKKKIYSRIDALSLQAAKLAVPNEFDKMVSSIGASGSNAFTSNEQTVYINEIPSNELEKWAVLESERFRELVLRLFHTELETVYEEFNRGQDNDGRKVYKIMFEELYKKHPYGTQPTIGHGEHLKNPSMVKIHQYFSSYYVPNNMAICIAGDIEPDKAMATIEKYFGGMQRKEVPPFTFSAENPIMKPVVRDVYGPMRESVSIGFRFGGIHSKDAHYLKLIDQILTNGQAGLIDLNLVQKQKVLSAGSMANVGHDYSSFQLQGVPRQGQSLDEIKSLLLEQLELVKKGEFEDWLLPAIINDLKLQEIRQNEQNWPRAIQMVSAFVLNRQWKEEVNELEELKKITKQELVEFAKQQFRDNYVVVLKHKGPDPSVFKVSKPKISPLSIERTDESAFYKKFQTLPSNRMKPVFLDYSTAIGKSSLTNNVSLSYIKNTQNELFSLYYILDMGTDNDKKLGVAIRYLPYLGTGKYPADALKKEFFKLGLNFDVFSSRDKVYVYLSGLNNSFEKGLELFEHILADVKGDEKALSDLISGIEKERADAKLNKGTILGAAMGDYAKYGEKAPFKNILSLAELKQLKPDELVQMIKQLTSYKHRVFYYGPADNNAIAGMINKYHKTPPALKDYPPAEKFTELPVVKNKVSFVDYDMVQVEMMMLSNGPPFDKSLLPYSNMFNEYFGRGLSSIVFQEIREAKALAYSAYSSYDTPDKMSQPYYVRAYIGTQADKLKDASSAMLNLMNNMPEAMKQFEDAKLSALKQIETERITKTSIFWSYEDAKKKGIDSDIRKDVYSALSTMTLADMKSFFDKQIKGRNYHYLLIGKKSDLDLGVLKSLGEYEELPLEKVFGY